MTAGIFRFLITAAAIPLCATYMDGVVLLDMRGAIVLGLILAAIYTVLRPLVRLLLSVINFCTLGILYVLVDAWMIHTAASLVENSVSFQSFWWALAVAAAINVARTLVDAAKGELRQ